MPVDFGARNALADKIVAEIKATPSITPPEMMAVIGAVAAKVIVLTQGTDGGEPTGTLAGRVTSAMNAQLALENASVYRPAKPLNGRFGSADGDE